MSFTNEEFRTSLGMNIRHRRNELKLTLKDVSERVGLSISFLGQIERGTSNMTVVDFQKVLTALNLTAVIVTNERLQSGETPSAQASE